MLPSTSDTFRYGASCFYTPLLEGGKIQVLVFIFWVDPYITIISAVLLKHLTLRKCGFNGLNSFCLFCLLFFGFYTLSLLPYRKTAVKSLILAPYAKHVTRGNREKRRLKIADVPKCGDFTINILHSHLEGYWESGSTGKQGERNCTVCNQYNWCKSFAH